MDAVLFERFHPEEFHRRFLEDGVRPDGRGPHDRRAARLHRSVIAAAHGSAAIRLGQSAAVAGVRAEVLQATPEQSAKVNHISASVELPPFCSAAFREKSRTLGVSTFLSNALADVLGSSDVLDPLQLCIREGELEWVLHVNVVCLNHDGNAFDLCLLAALAALEDTRLPALVEDPAPAPGGVRRLVEAPVGISPLVFEARQVALASRPLPVTFAQLPGGLWVLDPCAAEEALGAGVSLCLSGGRWLIYHQGGGTDANRILGELMPVARWCVPALVELLDRAGSEGAAGTADAAAAVA